MTPLAVSRRHRQLFTCLLVNGSKAILEALPAEFSSVLCAESDFYDTR
jgi:hypothetical protein